MSNKKDLALRAFEDTLIDYFHHNREDCEDLSKDELEDLIDQDELTINDLNNTLKLFLLKHYGKSDVELTDE